MRIRGEEEEEESLGKRNDTRGMIKSGRISG